MTVTIDLPAEVEKDVRRQAAKNGQDIGTFVLQAVNEKLLGAVRPDQTSHSENLVETVTSAPKQKLMGQFFWGISSVLELFPSPDRFDDWRLGQDILLSEWPAAVRGALAEMGKESFVRGDESL